MQWRVLGLKRILWVYHEALTSGDSPIARLNCNQTLLNSTYIAVN